MKMEVDEDGVIRRQTHSGMEQSGSSPLADDYPREMKAEADEEEDKDILGSSKVVAPFQLTSYPKVTKLELDTSPPMRLTDSRAHGGCSSLCSPMSSRIAPVNLFFCITPLCFLSGHFYADSPFF